MNATKERTREIMMETTPTPRAITPEDRTLTLCNEVFDFSEHVNQSLIDIIKVSGCAESVTKIKAALNQLKNKAMLTQRSLYGGPIDILA